MQEDGVCVSDPAFEFDAPRYHDFEAMEPESPSQTDAWFDTDGTLGKRLVHCARGRRYSQRVYSGRKLLLVLAS